MLFKTISPNKTPLQLPGLVVGNRSSAYFDLINTFYETDLKPSDYRDTQVFLNADNKAALELIPVKINSMNDILSFVSRATVKQVDSVIISNPLVNRMPGFLNVSPAWVLSEKEISFLKDLQLDTPRNIFSLGDKIPEGLAMMLNSIDGQPKWGTSPDAMYSTAGFSMEYYGSVDTATSDYIYPEQSTVVAIININRGGYTGKLMVCVK